MSAINWPLAMKPLLRKYRSKPHPLEYQNLYQLLVMVVLSARDSDKNINQFAPTFFSQYPDMHHLSMASEEALALALKKVRGGKNKARWLSGLSRIVKTDHSIPQTMDGLTALPGIGRKSANVIMREAGLPAEGVIVDLHVVRVAPRIGIAKGTDPKKIEQQIMEAMPQKDWGEIGMAISFLGREICRPSHPEHHDCPVRNHCEFYRQRQTTAKPAKKTPAKKNKAAKPEIKRPTATRKTKVPRKK